MKMSEQQKYVLHLENKVKQLEYLLEQERIKSFGLKRLLVEARFQLQPLLSKLDKVRKGE
jgi:hypothetical protein